MVFKGILKFVVFLLICTIFHLSSTSQNRKYFVINGKVTAQSVIVENGTIQIVKNNKQTYDTQIQDHGRFRLELEYNSKYVLVFKQKDHQTKTIEVNTELPTEVFIRPENFPNFQMAINLFEGKDAENQNIYHVSYSANNQCFAKVPSEFDVEIIENDEPNLTQNIQKKENKSKLPHYHIF